MAKVAALLLLAMTSSPLFLNPGAYTVSGSGGSGVGPFSFPMSVTTGATWTNRDQISVIDRTQGLIIRWSGGDSTKQVGMILGLASNPAISASGSFACLDQGSFTVPPSMMASRPELSSSTSTRLRHLRSITAWRSL